MLIELAPCRLLPLGQGAPKKEKKENMKRYQPFLILTLIALLAAAAFVPFSQAAAVSGGAQQQNFLPLAGDFQSVGASLLAGKEYACSVVSQSPKDWTTFKPRRIFDAKWTVRNTGTKTWSTSGTDLQYVGGTKMQTHGDVFDISKSVAPDGKISLIVDMNAPKNPGYYTTYWGLSNNGGKVFCRFYLIIKVK